MSRENINDQIAVEIDTNDSISTNFSTINSNTIATSSGNLTAGVMRVCLATNDVNASLISSNTTAIASDTLTLSGAVSSSRFQCNVSQLGGNAIATNTGLLTGGTQRITIATDDPTSADIDDIATNISNVTKTLGTDTYTEASTKAFMIAGVRNDSGATNFANINNEVCPLAVNSTGQIQTDFYSVRGSTIAVNSGANSGGTIRVTLATDDQTADNINNITKIGGSDTYTEASTKGLVMLGARNDSIGTSFASTNNELCPIATDSTGVVCVKLHKLNGNTVQEGSGTNGNGVLRVSLATNDQSATNIATLSGAVSSSKYQVNLSSQSNTYMIQNYVNSVISGSRTYYRYNFGDVAYSTNTLQRVFWELTIETNQAVNYSSGLGIVFNSTENGSTTRTTTLETRHKIPLVCNSVVVFNFGIDSASAYNSTNQCQTIFGLNGYTSGAYIGLNAINDQQFQIVDGNTTANQNTWNIDQLNGSGISGYTLTFGANNYSFFIMLANPEINESVIFGFVIRGQFCPVHQITHQNQTVANTRNTRGTLILKAISFTGNVGNFFTLRSIDLLTPAGFSINSFLRNNFLLSSGVAVANQTWTTSTTTKTIMIVSLNQTFANSNICLFPYSFFNVSVVSLGGTGTVAIYYVPDFSTITGGSGSTTITPTTPLGAIFDLTYGHTGEPTYPTMYLIGNVLNMSNGNFTSFTSAQCANNFMYLGQSTAATKTALVFQFTPLNSTTGTMYNVTLCIGYH